MLIDIISEEIVDDLGTVIFKLTFKNDAFTQSQSKMSMISKNNKPNLRLKSDIFFELFPFHLVFKRDMQIISAGEALLTAIKNCNGEFMSNVFNLDKPLIDFTWENVCF